MVTTTTIPVVIYSGNHPEGHEVTLHCVETVSRTDTKTVFTFSEDHARRTAVASLNLSSSAVRLMYARMETYRDRPCDCQPMPSHPF